MGKDNIVNHTIVTGTLAEWSFEASFSSPLVRARETARLAGFDPWIDDDLVEWDYGVPEPYTNIPPEDDAEDTHEYPRRSPAGMLQLAHFLETGEVLHFCEGPCDSDDQ